MATAKKAAPVKKAVAKKAPVKKAAAPKNTAATPAPENVRPEEMAKGLHTHSAPKPTPAPAAKKKKPGFLARLFGAK